MGWRGLWAYITTAPPTTAIHYIRSEGWTLGDKIAAEQLSSQRELAWRYTAVHFENGDKIPPPEPISYPGDGNATEDAGGQPPQTLDELISPEVRKLLRGA